jgi:hypothetical protein
MDEPVKVTAARAVGERQRNLDHSLAGAQRVDRHRQLHPEPRRERDDRAERGRAERALATDRRAQPRGCRVPDRPAREPDREPEPTALTGLKDGDRNVRLACGDRLGERPQAPRARPEIGVAEDVDRVRTAELERVCRGSARRSALAAASTPNNAGALGARQRGGGVA